MNDQDSGGILTEAQTEEIKNKFLTPAQRLAKEKRDADTKHKREERARERVKKELTEITSIAMLAPFKWYVSGFGTFVHRTWSRTQRMPS
jgi:hypothetical protein